MLDLVVDRRELKTTLARVLRFMRAAPAASVAVPVEAAALPVSAEPAR
jgi:acetyl-CoA carboxylase beta subunit